MSVKSGVAAYKILHRYNATWNVLRVLHVLIWLINYATPSEKPRCPVQDKIVTSVQSK